ncbi:MAG: YeeE/YedE family protein, partial [Rhodospirillales bacterium]
MSADALTSSRIQGPVLVLALAAAAVVGVEVMGVSAKKASLFLVAIAMGVSLYHASFGFSGAYRRAIRDKDITGVAAQLVMLALAMVLFAPVLAKGSIFGHGVGGALAPVSVSMAFGAFLFGIGMQIGGACASGTLYTAASGRLRMVVVLVFFCAGAFWGSLDLHWWSKLPGIGSISLGRLFGFGPALALQLAVLAAVYLVLRRLGGRINKPLWEKNAFSWRRLLRGPWPLLMSAALLALLNWATLLIAGHAWSITWAFSLWSAKAAVLLGWDPATSPFWSGGYRLAALSRSVLADTTSVMNIGIMLGAMIAASLAGRAGSKVHIPLASLAAAVVGGLMMGYGARLAYGCNIGAFFSGAASMSLHGWVWILAAIPGN